MKQIYEQGTLQMVRSQTTLFLWQNRTSTRAKRPLSTVCMTAARAVSPVTRSVFLLAKFGNIFEQFENDPNEFISCKAVILPDFRTLIVLKNGSAVIYGKRTAKSSGAATPFTRIRLLPPLPSPGTPFGRHIKIPRPLLPIPPSIISARTLRIGGDGDLPTGLCGLYVCDDGALRVCAADEKR